MWFQKPPLGVGLDWSNPHNKGLMMHLAMNEGHGDVVRDLSLCGNHGKLHGMAFPSTPASGWNPGRKGIGLNFDGASDYIDCGNNESLNITGNITISFWGKLPQSQERYATVVGKWVTSPSRRAYGIMIEANQIQFYLSGNGYDWTNAVYTPATYDIWTHTVATYDGTTMRIYENGVEKNNTPYSDGILSDPTQNLLIGGRVSNRNILGSIDDVRLHNRTQSAKEIMDYCINPFQVYPYEANNDHI